MIKERSKRFGIRVKGQSESRNHGVVCQPKTLQIRENESAHLRDLSPQLLRSEVSYNIRLFSTTTANASVSGTDALMLLIPLELIIAEAGSPSAWFETCNITEPPALRDQAGGRRRSEHHQAQWSRTA